MEGIKVSIVTIVVLAVIVIVLVIIAGIGIINFDLMSYTATGSESMGPAGADAGKALVVYSPGVTGAAKSAAADIARDLKSRGYKVELAGVRSTAAANTSGYDTVIVGGPMYFGTASSSIAAYLKALTLQKEVRLGVFATTGSNDFVASDLVSLEKQVASLQSDKKAAIKLIPDRDEKKAAQGCEELVSATIQ